MTLFNKMKAAVLMVAGVLMFAGGADAATVSGKVTDKDNIALEYATVYLRSTAKTYYENTNSSGVYTINNVDAGTYAVTIQKIGFMAQTKGSITVSTSDLTDNDFMFDGFKVSGTISKADNSALGGNNNFVYLYSGTTQITGDYVKNDGTYELNGVANGMYTIVTSCQGYVDKSLTVTVSAADLSNQNLAVGGNYKVSGTITGGDPPVAVGSTQVYLYVGSERVGWTLSESDGTYEIEGVENGEYTIEVSASVYNYVYGKSASFTVNSANVPNKDLVLETAKTISGTITTGSPPAPVQGARIRLKDGSGYVGTVTTVSTNSAGEYTLTDVASGTYTIEVSKEGYVTGTITSVTVASENVTGKDLVLVAGGTGPGSISGKISGSDQGTGNLPVAATVKLLKNGVGYPTAQSPFTFTAAANGDGSYTLSGIPVGVYTVQASMSGYKTGTTGNISVGTTAMSGRNLVLDKAYLVTYTISGASTDQNKIKASESNGKPVPTYSVAGADRGVKENTTVTFEVDTTGDPGWQVKEWKLNGVTVRKGRDPRYTVLVGKAPVSVEAVTIGTPSVSATLVGLDTSKFQVNRPVNWQVRYELKNGLTWGDAKLIEWGEDSTGKESPFRIAAGKIPNGLTERVVKISPTLVVDTIKGTISGLASGDHDFALRTLTNAEASKYIFDNAPTPIFQASITTETPAQVAGFPAKEGGLNVKPKTVIALDNILIDNTAATYQIGQERKVTPSISSAFASTLTADGGAAVFHVTYRDGNGTVVSQALVKDSVTTANYGVLNAGNYTVSVRAFNRYYEGTKSATFVVNKRDISLTSNNIAPTVATAGSLTYDGRSQEQNVTVTVKDGQTTLIPGVDWDGGWTGTHTKTGANVNGKILGDPINAGVDTVKVKGVGNYTGTRITTYSINKMRIYVDTSSMSAYARPYNGTSTFDTIPSTGTATAYQLNPAILFSEAANDAVAIKGTSSGIPSGSAVLNHRTQYVVTAGNFANAGGTPTADSATATRVKVTVKLLDSLNYTLSATATATSGGSVDFFKKATINRAVPDTSHFKFSIPETLVHGYTGKARGIGDVTLKTTLSGMGKFRVLYGADTAKPVNVGSYPVTVVVDSLGANFRQGTVALGTYTISAPGVPVIDDVEWQTGITAREGVALALTVPATAPTTGGTLSYQWFRDDVAVANNGRAATLNVNGLIMGNTYTFKVIVTNTKSAGAAGSEVGTAERVVTVNVIEPPISLSTATFTVKGAYVYTGSSIEPPSDSIIVTVPSKTPGGDPVTLTRNVDYTVSFARNTNVGSATISITGVDEYIGLRTATFQIRAKTPDANDLTYRGTTVYNGKTQAVTVSPIAGTGLGTVTVKYDGNVAPPKDAGMYVITADFAAGTNFTAATNVQLGFYTISPLTLTADSLIFKRWPNQILVDSVAKYAIGDVFVRVDSTKLTVLYAGDEEVPTTIGSYPVTVLVEDENFVTGLIPLGEFNVVDSVVSVKSGDRVILGTGAREVAAVAPVKAATAVFTAGPSPVSKNGTIKFFSAKQVTSGSLYIFDATGKSVAKVGVKAGIGEIGSWSANAAEGSYIVKGVLAGKDGTREKVSFVFSVVK